MVVRDAQSCLPLSSMLTDDDLVVLLTPVVAPLGSKAVDTQITSDPFEPLGRALSRYHSRVRHVPYTAKMGITSTHVGFIKRATVVVFVISGPPSRGQISQAELADIAWIVGEQRPHIVIACCDVEELEPGLSDFPTVFQLPGYAPKELEVAVELLFKSSLPSKGAVPKLQSLMLAPQEWNVDVWNPACDPGMDEIHNLWCECMPEKYHLDLVTFQSMLRRDGWVRHYIVREPGSGEILGFCATYTTYIGSGTESLMGSLAAVIVRPSSRQRGVGRSLHDHALRQFTKLRGVERIQLGSTFPRLLFGLPVGTAAEGWFRRRGWRMDGQEPGTGQEVSDWILGISDWPFQRTLTSTTSLIFRPCEFHEYQEVLDMVSKQATRNGHVGWFDQYARLEGEMNIRDIVVGIADGTIIASALTYVRNNQSYVLDDIPWPAVIGGDVGGITCICITGSVQQGNLALRRRRLTGGSDDNLLNPNGRDDIMARLLDGCIKHLSQFGVQRIFLDALPSGDEKLQALGKCSAAPLDSTSGSLYAGFREWARYRDVWRKV